MGPEQSVGAFEFEGQHYAVTARWPRPGETTSEDRHGNPDEGDQHIPCIVTIRRSDGFSRSGRLTISGMALSSLGRPVTTEQALKFYFAALPALMRLSPATTRSWPGLLLTPEHKWFHHCFGINDITALRE